MSKNCFPKIQNLKLEIPRLQEFSGKIEILSTHNLFSRKFAAVSLENCRFLLTPNA